MASPTLRSYVGADGMDMVVETAAPGSPRLKGFTFGAALTTSRTRLSASPKKSAKASIRVVDPEAPRWFEAGGGCMTSFHRGRHGLDPNRIPSNTPGPCRHPKLTQTKKRVTGYGFGASTSSRGLVKHPSQIAKERDAQRKARRAAARKRRERARRVARGEVLPDSDDDDDGAAGRSRRMKAADGSLRTGHSPPPRRRTGSPMISSARRSSPLMWEETSSHVHVTREEGSRVSPGPASYGMARNLDQTAMSKTGGRFGSGVRNYEGDPQSYIQITPGPGPAYHPGRGIALQLSHKPTPVLGGRLFHGSYLQGPALVASPGPKYLPDKKSAANYSFSFGSPRSLISPINTSRTSASRGASRSRMTGGWRDETARSSRPPAAQPFASATDSRAIKFREGEVRLLQASSSPPLHAGPQLHRDLVRTNRDTHDMHTNTWKAIRRQDDGEANPRKLY